MGLREIEAEIRSKGGAFRQVGCKVVRERLQREEELLAQRCERQAEMEKDYGGADRVPGISRTHEVPRA